VAETKTEATSYGTKRFFKGLLDEVALFNRALYADEVQAIFRAGSAGMCKSSTSIYLPSILK
jgi:hypothetical protein